jgi:hypothetical protein
VHPEHKLTGPKEEEEEERRRRRREIVFYEVYMLFHFNIILRHNGTSGSHDLQSIRYDEL